MFTQLIFGLQFAKQIQIEEASYSAIYQAAQQPSLYRLFGLAKQHQQDVFWHKWLLKTSKRCLGRAARKRTIARIQLNISLPFTVLISLKTFVNSISFQGFNMNYDNWYRIYCLFSIRENDDGTITENLLATYFEEYDAIVARDRFMASAPKSKTVEFKVEESNIIGNPNRLERYMP